MPAGHERDALVSATLALKRLARDAYMEGAPRAATEALSAARKAEAALGSSGIGCPGCGEPVIPTGNIGRPRRWCVRCRVPRISRLKPTG